MRFTHLALGLASSALLTTAARADFTITRTSVLDVDALVPDGGYTFDVRTIDFGGGTITDVNVGLVLTPTEEGAWAGDYYAALGHGDTDGYAVLLNRIGKTDTDDFGSNANGINVTFDDDASTDVHLAPYSTASDNPPALTGTWKSDGREADPVAVTHLTARTATLTSFNTRPVNGEWRLVVADDSSYASARLSSWSLTVTFTPDGGVLPSLSASDTLTIRSGTVELTTPQIVAANIVNQGILVGPSAPGQTLTFTGAVTGAGDFQGNFLFQGSFSPGNSPAAVTFDGDTVFDAGHVLTMEIGGTTPGAGYDTISVTGTLGLGGTLNIVFINGFIPAPSDFFQFFTANSIGGNFAQVNLPTGYVAVGGVRFGNGFTLSAIPEPAAFAILASLGGLALAATRRRRRA